MGSSVWSSMKQKSTRKATPAPSSASTVGLVHPMGELPYGSIP